MGVLVRWREGKLRLLRRPRLRLAGFAFAFGFFLADGRDFALSRGLFLLGLHRRRSDDGGDGEVAVVDRRLGALGQLDLADVDRIADVEAGRAAMWISSGISAASQTSSRSWRTTLSTPPRFRPGEASSLSKRTGTLTVTLLCSPMRRKSTWIGRLVTGWNCDVLGQGAVGLAADVDHDDRIHEVAA